MEDRLGNAFQKLGMSGKDGIDFTPPDLTRLMARIAVGAQFVLPPEGYFTVTDPTCGSGITLLAAAEQIADAGYNPCQHLVMQAADLNRTCAHMAYVNLSLYGIRPWSYTEHPHHGGVQSLVHARLCAGQLDLALPPPLRLFETAVMSR